MEKIGKIHLSKINKMLMAMAQGNFFYRLERTQTNDNVEAMTLVLNMLAEEIQETLVHGGFVNSDGVVKHLVKMSFLLDAHGAVTMVNQEACLLLSYLRKDIIGANFTDFLDPTSKKNWKEFIKKMDKRDNYDSALEITFVTKDGLLIPRLCHITSCLGDSNKKKCILVMVVLQTKDLAQRDELQKRNIVSGKKIAMENPKRIIASGRNQARLSFDDIRKIRQGRNIIMNNLEQDFPSLKEFAHQLGTNEFKLKYGFKELYGTTVYRFLLQERLRKAKMLIEHADFTIKTIAYRTGFKSIPHFSRAFKKRYGFAPSELRKQKREER